MFIYLFIQHLSRKCSQRAKQNSKSVRNTLDTIQWIHTPTTHFTEHVENTKQNSTSHAVHFRTQAYARQLCGAVLFLNRRGAPSELFRGGRTSEQKSELWGLKDKPQGGSQLYHLSVYCYRSADCRAPLPLPPSPPPPPQHSIFPLTDVWLIHIVPPICPPIFSSWKWFH